MFGAVATLEFTSLQGAPVTFGDMFSTESGRMRKLEPRWRGPFMVLSYHDIKQDYTVKMDARMY